MPGSGQLHIDVMDHDNAFTHDLIGRAVIDLESRFFNGDWENLSNKPIERVPIYNEEYFDAQGYIKLWIDIMDKSETQKRNNPVFIQPRPPTPMEVRLIIWESEGLPNKDIEGSDFFFNVTIDKEAQGTDVHFNSWDGVGSFNWRVVMPIDYDDSSNRDIFVNLQAYDYDLFSKDDFIAKKSFSITKLLKDIDIYDVPLKLDKNYFNEYIKKDYERQIKDLSLNEPDLKIRNEKIKVIESQFNFYEFDSEDPKKIWITLDSGCLSEERDAVK
jgi:hypothetical protein